MAICWEGIETLLQVLREGVMAYNLQGFVTRHEFNTSPYGISLVQVEGFKKCVNEVISYKSTNQSTKQKRWYWGPARHELQATTELQGWFFRREALPLKKVISFEQWKTGPWLFRIHKGLYYYSSVIIIILLFILLSMAEILHHLGCKKLSNNRKNNHLKWFAGFQPSTVLNHGIRIPSLNNQEAQMVELKLLGAEVESGAVFFYLRIYPPNYPCFVGK